MPLTPPSRRVNQLGSGFTNIQRVLQANKANSLGSTVGAGIKQAGQTAQKSIDDAGQAFNVNVATEKDRLANEKGRVDRVLGGNVAQATDEDVNAFEGIRGGQTKADTSIKNADELAEKGREAQSLGQATGNEGGRFGLLQRYVGGNQRYTGGQQRLDNMLLGQTGQADLRKARVETSGLQDKALGLSYAAEQQGQELKNRAKGLADDTIGRLGVSATDYNAAMEQKAIDAAAAREAQVKQILSGDLQVEEPIYNQLAKVLDPSRDVLNTELNDYIKANNEKANRFGIQEQSDFDKIKMLQKLSGNSVTGDAGKLLQEYNLLNPEEVGAFQKSDLFKLPSKIALDEGISSKEKEYGGVKAATDNATRYATRFLADSQPDVYSQTGGYYGDLLAQYGQKGYEQSIANKYKADPAGMTEQYGTLDQYLKSNPYNPNSARVALPDSRGDINAFLPGSNYIQQVYGSKMNDIQAAKNSGMVSQDLLNKIAAQEAALKEAEEKAKQNKQFYRVGRVLTKKPTTT